MGGMGWHDVAMVEFKLDTKDGGPKLVEVKGRFGLLPLLIAPGVGFPCLPCTMATEENVDPVFGDGAWVGCRPARAIPRDLLLSAASLRDGRGRERWRWN